MTLNSSSVRRAHLGFLLVLEQVEEVVPNIALTDVEKQHMHNGN